MQKRTLLRTPETYAEYKKAPAVEGCFICAAPGIENYYFWKLIKNDFPYDAVTNEHAMLVPKRHIARRESLFGAERLELDFIKRTFDTIERFDAAIENFAANRTFLPHYHLHLVKWKRQ